MTHTPTPWHFYELRGDDGLGYIRGPDENEIAHHGDRMNSPAVNRANAAFIIRACNSHDDLVAALEAARSQLVTLGGDQRKDPSVFNDAIQATVLNEIDAALAKATAPKEGRDA